MDRCGYVSLLSHAREQRVGFPKPRPCLLPVPLLVLPYSRPRAFTRLAAGGRNHEVLPPAGHFSGQPRGTGGEWWRGPLPSHILCPACETGPKATFPAFLHAREPCRPGCALNAGGTYFRAAMTLTSDPS